jgi:hypothetical protein
MLRLETRRIHAAICLTPILLMLASAFASTARADTELQWKFKQGTKTRFEMKMDAVRETKSRDMVFQLTINQIMDMTWEVVDVAADGTATLHQTVDRVRLEVNLPQAGQPPVKFDTQQPTKTPGTEIPAKIFGAMVGKPFTVKVTPTGKVLDMTPPEGLTQAFKNMPSGGAMFSEDGLKQMITQSVMPMPEGPVAVGKSWESTAELDTPPFGKQISTTHYKYAGNADADGKKLEKIDITMDVKLEPAADAQAKIKLKDNDASGEILWDGEAGQPVMSQVKTKTSFDITVDSMTVEEKFNTSSTMKRLESGEAREL